MIRALLFYLFATLWTFFVGIVFFPLVFLPAYVIVIVVGKSWAYGLYFLLRLFCNLKMEARGLENIPKGPVIFASKHQSALETIMMHILIKRPVFVLKKELLNLPVFGFYLKTMGMVYIDRDGGLKTLKHLLKQVQERISQEYSIIIFPEGTRTKPGESAEYNPGIAAIYNLDIAPIIPIALNTGKFWSKNTIVKNPGNFVIEFLPEIPKNLAKQEFMAILKHRIESKSSSLTQL